MAATLKGLARRSGRNDLGVRTYTNVYKVETSSTSDGVNTVAAASGLPAYGDTYATDSAAYCVRIEADNTDPWKGWEVTCTWSTDRSIDGTTPANDQVLVSWTSELYQEPVFVDTSGNAILNSAGDYFIDPVPMRDASHLIARIRANVAAVPSWVITYQNAVNNGAITIGGLAIAEGLAKVQRIDISEPQLRDSSTYYGLTLEVHIHADGWHLQPVDAGFRQINARGVPIQIINTDDEQEVTSPALLDGNGAALEPATPATAVYGDFTIYPEKDFTVLPGVS